MFIEKLEYTADINLMVKDLDKVISEIGWLDTNIEGANRLYSANQLSLTHRIGAEYPWYDANGSLYDRTTGKFIDKETSFTEWNSVGDYTKNVIEGLKEFAGVNFGRMRYMRLMPKRGLSVHRDFDARYHFVLKTNQFSYFALAESDGDSLARCYHIPMDGHFYKVDTLREHFVYNGDSEPRIHLVLSEIK